MPKVKPSLFLTAVLLSAAVSAAQQADSLMGRRFLWNEAQARMGSARTTEAFTGAADTYRRLIETGVRNGPLFYNLGLALMQAERYEEALSGFHRAERYMGSNEDIKHNIRICLSQGDQDKATGLPWYRFLLFWHFGLPGSVRLTIALSAFAVCWLSLLLRLIGPRQTAEALLAMSLVVFVLFASSAATTLYQEHRDSLFTPPPENELTQAEPSAPGGVESRGVGSP